MPAQEAARARLAPFPALLLQFMHCGATVSQQRICVSHHTHRGMTEMSDMEELGMQTEKLNRSIQIQPMILH